MRIRKRLTLLFIAGALLPLIAITLMHQASMRKLGQEISAYTETLLTTTERDFLRKTVEDYSRILRRDKRAVEIAARMQARNVERSLAAEPPPAPDVHFSEAFKPDEDPVPGLTVSYKHLKRRGGYEREAVWVNYDRQVFHLPPGLDAQEVSGDLARLAPMKSAYQSIYRTCPELIYWQQTVLESGLTSCYPGHARYPSDYDPRSTDWYQRAKGSTGSVTVITTEAANGILTQVTALPLRGPDGAFTGVTAIHIPLSAVFESLHLPRSWEEHAETMLVMFERNGPRGPGKLRLLVHKNSHALKSMLRSPGNGRKAYLSPDDGEAFQSILKDASLGYSGVQRISHRERQLLYAYGAHSKGEPFPVIILPYEEVLAKASEMRSLVQNKTEKWLELTGLALVGAITLSVLLALFSARTVIRPVMHLAGAANGLAKGNFGARAEISSGDELEELGDIFNSMGPRLQENESMRHAIAVAKQTQQYLLPKQAPRLEHYDISGVSVYSDETGGDYFDYIEIADAGEGKLGIAVGDVSGHGIAAALLMASARGVIRSHATRFNANLDTLFEMFNAHLMQDTSDSQFLTLFYGVLDARENTLIWCSAGHDPGLLLRRRNGEIHELANTGMPLGISDHAGYEQAGPIQLEDGDLILIGTDGIRETRNANREMFGVERLHTLLKAHAHQTTRQICDRIVQALNDFRQGTTQEDDVTMVAVKYQPHAGKA